MPVGARDEVVAFSDDVDILPLDVLTELLGAFDEVVAFPDEVDTLPLDVLAELLGAFDEVVGLPDVFDPLTNEIDDRVKVTVATVPRLDELETLPEDMLTFSLLVLGAEGLLDVLKVDKDLVDEADFDDGRDEVVGFRLSSCLRLLVSRMWMTKACLRMQSLRN